MPAKKTRASKAKATKQSTKKAGTVLLVNMIPKSLSGETHQDSEPTIAVNPKNPQHIAASAFTPDPSHGPRAPIYISTDGGATWTLNSIVPSTVADGSATADITVAFGSSSDILYAGIIRFPFSGEQTRINILRTTDFQSSTTMSVLVDRQGAGVDQPYVQAITRGGKDLVYVGDNDFNAPSGNTATIDQTLDGGAGKPTFKKIRLESRSTSGQDGPPVRPAVHADGTVYAIFHSWKSFDRQTGEGMADIVVVRDDHGGNSTKPFADLIDPIDNKAGVRVVRGAKFNFNGEKGQQRLGGDVALCVDPTNSDIIYIAYNDDQPNGVYALHLLRSTDRGKTWSPELRRLDDALNPALAINSAGKIGFLYQRLMGIGAAQQWVTRFESSTNGTTWTAITLSQAPANRPRKDFDPYLGDYEHLQAVGKDFYGVFSANNSPKKANFPSGVVYQRNANWETNTLLDVDNITPVAISIDPFFFKFTG
ncbi:MAG TPA: hypothetical protein VHQ64_19120 [Pyrinomonadaceae bacterium]|jgi:hypothetical protein|nr:hypothetical protein [Pyrinomonadaceae bacterium]